MFNNVYYCFLWGPISPQFRNGSPMNTSPPPKSNDRRRRRSRRTSADKRDSDSTASFGR
jgi:hypothetical protein